MVASYLVGRFKYPIPYEVGRLVLYAVTAMALWGAATLLSTGNNWIDFPTRVLLLAVYAGVVFVNEVKNRRKPAAV